MQHGLGARLQARRWPAGRRRRWSAGHDGAGPGCPSARAGAPCTGRAGPRSGWVRTRCARRPSPARAAPGSRGWSRPAGHCRRRRPPEPRWIRPAAAGGARTPAGAAREGASPPGWRGRRGRGSRRRVRARCRGRCRRGRSSPAHSARSWSSLTITTSAPRNGSPALGPIFAQRLEQVVLDKVPPFERVALICGLRLWAVCDRETNASTWRPRSASGCAS